jgi:hypothetical protein
MHDPSHAGIFLTAEGYCIAQSLNERLDHRGRVSHGAALRDEISPIDE